MQPKIVFLDSDTIGPSVRLRQPEVAHEWVVYANTAPDQVVARAAEADIIITNKVPLSADIVAQLPQLRMVSVAATGYDAVDVAACAQRGVVVSNVRGYAVHTLPEHVFALLFALQRNVVNYRQDVIDGAWSKSRQFCLFSHRIKDLHGATMGIVGRGVLGQAVAARAKAFGMQVRFAGRKGVTDPDQGYMPFDEVLSTSDVISLHLPLLEATRDLISYQEFALMQQQPLLINTARGGLVNETAAVDALNSGQIAGLGFDVLTAEPPPVDNPLLAVADRSNVIITPHVAWASTEAMQALWDQTVGHIDSFLAGNPANIVT